MGRIRPAAFLACVATLAFAAPAGAVTITEFPIEPGAAAGAHAPRYVHVGPDQNLWFADGGNSSGIGRISTGGAQIAPIPDPYKPEDLVVASDGTVDWTSDRGVGVRLPNGTVRTDSIPMLSAYGIGLTSDGKLVFSEQSTTTLSAGLCAADLGLNAIGCGGFAPDTKTRLTGITLGPDGRLWLAGYEENAIRRQTPDGQTTATRVDPPIGSGPARLAVGADGNLWVTMFDGSRIDRLTTSGVLTPFALPAGRGPNDIVAGPDGALWFTEFKAGKIGRITTAGVLTNEFDIPTAGSQPIGITAGPDGALWFTESATGKIGRLQLDAASGGGGAGGGGAGVSDRFAPRFLRGPAFSPTRFRVAAGATPTSARARRAAPRGSSLTYSLSEPAAVSIVIAQPRSGRRVGRSCRAPTRSNRRRARCTRYVTAGTLKRRALQGANKVAFTGRIGRRALNAGSYRATVTAKDAAGNVSKPSTASFTIAAR